MIDVLKADLYRFKCQRMTWILFIIAGAVTLITSVSFGFVLGNAPWLKDYLKEISGLYEEYGITNPFDVISESYDFKADTVYEFIALNLSRELVLIGALFTIVFSVRFRRTGYIVNVFALKKRSSFYFSNALILLLFTVLLVVTVVLSVLPSALIFYEDYPKGDTKDFVLYLLLLTLLVFTVLLQIVTYTRLARGPMAGIYTVIFYVLFGASIIYRAIDGILHTVFRTDFYIEYLLPLGNTDILTLGKYNTYLSAAIVIVLFVGINMVLELVAFKNKDVI